MCLEETQKVLLCTVFVEQSGSGSAADLNAGHAVEVVLYDAFRVTEVPWKPDDQSKRAGETHMN